MASLSHITEASVLRVTSSVKMPALNVGGIVAYTTAITGRYAIYGSTPEVSTVFGAVHPITLAAGQFFAQNPAPSTFVVFRAALPSTKTYVITPTAANGKHYKLKLTAVDQTTTEVDYTADGSATAQEIVEGLKTLIDALTITGLTVTEDNTALTLTMTAGTWLSAELSGTADDGVMTILETTADPGYATDLAAILAVFRDWFKFGILDNSVACNSACSAWAEANGKKFYALSNDSISLTESTADIGSVAKAATRDLTDPVFHEKPNEFAQFALMSRMLSQIPGKRAAFHKVLSNVTVSPLNETQITNLKAKNYTYLVEFGSLNRTDGGKAASGEWSDIIFGAHYYDARWEQMDATLTLSEPDKIDFDAAGIEKHANVARDLVAEMLQNNFIRLDFTAYPEFGYKLVVPNIDDISAADLAARELNGIEIEAKLKGAIKKTKFTLRLVI
jgi:hypothetical protein